VQLAQIAGAWPSAASALSAFAAAEHWVTREILLVPMTEVERPSARTLVVVALRIPEVPGAGESVWLAHFAGQLRREMVLPVQTAEVQPRASGLEKAVMVAWV